MADILHQPSLAFSRNAHLNKSQYEALYKQSITDPESFWSKHGKRLEWIKNYSKIKNVSFEHPNVSIKWFEDGVLNVSANCIDRHLSTRGEQTAIIWEGDNPSEEKHISYSELYEKV